MGSYSPVSRRHRRASSDVDPYSAAHIYYGVEADKRHHSHTSRRSSYSTVCLSDFRFSLTAYSYRKFIFFGFLQRLELDDLASC